MFPMIEIAIIATSINNSSILFSKLRRSLKKVGFVRKKKWKILHKIVVILIWEMPRNSSKTLPCLGCIIWQTRKLPYWKGMLTLIVKLFDWEASNWFYRFLWFVVGACMVSLTAIIIYSLQDELFNHPTITSLERRDYPVDNIDFPGVAVCNVNMISKKRANAIAQKM